MPKYFYKCLEEGCEEVFEIAHSMKDKLETCSQCSTKCEKEGNIERIPMNIVTMLKKNIKISFGFNVGRNSSVSVVY